MRLQDLYDKYVSGALDKTDYISAMHKNHAVLFDYFDYIKNTDIQSITIDNNAMYVTIKGSLIKLFLDKADSRFIPIEILNFHSFDPIEKNLIFHLAKQSKVIFDIGANIGWYALNFGILENVEKVYSFEPIPYTYEYLVKHIELNGLSKITPNNVALSDRIGDAEFYWTELETGSSSMRNIRKRDKINIVRCKTQTLDSYVKEKNTTVDMIKCDVEGAELLVFKGAMEVLRLNQPMIFTEMLRKWSAEFDYHPNDIIRLLSEVGYLCFAYEDGNLKKIATVTPDTKPTNFFFLHSDKHMSIIQQFGCNR